MVDTGDIGIHDRGDRDARGDSDARGDRVEKIFTAHS